jgi:hypothetical protein
VHLSQSYVSSDVVGKHGSWMAPKWRAAAAGPGCALQAVKESADRRAKKERKKRREARIKARIRAAEMAKGEPCLALSNMKWLFPNGCWELMSMWGLLQGLASVKSYQYHMMWS